MSNDRLLVPAALLLSVILAFSIYSPAGAEPSGDTPPPVSQPQRFSPTYKASSPATPPPVQPSQPVQSTPESDRFKPRSEESALDWLARSSRNLAADPRGIFEKNPAVEVGKQLEDLPFDNAAKYGALYVLSQIPATAPVAIPAAKAELLKDVAVATAKGLINAMRLTDAQRNRAMSRIAVLQAVGNWGSFINDISDIANITPEKFTVALGVLPSTIQDLYQGADALSGALALGVPAKIKAADIYSSFCSFEEAEKLYGEIYDELGKMMPEAALGMIENHAVIVGADPRFHNVSMDTLRTFPINTNPESGNFSSYVRFATFRNRYFNAMNLREEISGKLKTLRKAKADYPREMKEVKAKLQEAAVALTDCETEKGGRILEEIRSKYLETTLKGIVKDEQAAVDSKCWDWLADEYNRIRRDYIEWADYYRPGMDTERIDGLTRAAMAELDPCRLGPFNDYINQIEGVLRNSRGKCVNREMAERRIAALKRKYEEALGTRDCPDETEQAGVPADEDVDKAYVVVRLSGSGFYPHWAGGSHKISGSAQFVYTIVKGNEPLPTLEEISRSYRGDACQMASPWGFGWMEDTPPQLFNQKKPAVKLMTAPYKNLEDIDRSLLYDDWESSGSDGPGLYELKKGCK